MMGNDLISLAYQLHDAIEADPRILRLKMAEKAMENDEKVMRLAYTYDLAQTQYNDTLKIFSETSKEAVFAQRILYESKKKLDENALVADYNKAYREVRVIYSELQDKIFAPFNLHECGEKK